MSLFGSGSAQFEISGSGALITLEHSNLIPEFVIPDETEHVSVLTGKKSYTTLGDYSKFTVQLNLFKYTLPAPKFNDIYAYNHSNVYFWPHADGHAISGSDGIPVLFHITNMRLRYLENTKFRPVMDIEFDSINYTSLTGSLL